MSLTVSTLIKKFINHNDLDLTKIEDIILESDFTPLEFCDQCVNILLELNFTGPVNTEIEANVSLNKEMLSKINQDLTCEGEVPFLKTKGIVLLWIVKCISSKMSTSKLSAALRYKFCLLFLQSIYIHQATFRDHISATLSKEVELYLDLAFELKSGDMENIIDCVNEFQVSILGSYLLLNYYNYERSDKLFKNCMSLMGLNTSFSGAIGKRTKFQTTEVSQLYLEVTRDDSDTARIINETIEASSTPNLPNDQFADDELLLDEIDYQEKLKFKQCTVAEQAVLLLQCELHFRSNGKDEHMTEQCDAIVFAAMGGPKNRSSIWSLASEALLYKSRHIPKSSRKLEKSIGQLEELSLQFNHALPNAEDRRKWFFLSRSCSIWELQTHYGNILFKLGMYKSALDVLIQWDQWSPIIDCYTRLGQREKAVIAIKNRIDTDGETAELLCCLGDVTQDRSHYDRAWIASKQRSSRAMRSLACHFMYVDRDLAKAVECFELSLANNVMQINTWFTYGCCCIQLKEYRKAVSAFKQCLTFEQDNYEAWCNCASALTELGEDKNALTFLKEGIKYSYQIWKVWDSLCIVSARVGDYQTTIKAYHQIIDLQKQHRDPVSLARLVRAVADNAEDWCGNNSECYRGKLKELFARISSVDGRDPRLFMLHAELLESDPDKSNEMKQRILTCLSKSYHGMSQQIGWERDSVSCRRVLTSVLRLVDRSLDFAVDYTSARLAVKSALAMVVNRQSERMEALDSDISDLITKMEEANDILATK